MKSKFNQVPQCNAINAWRSSRSFFWRCSTSSKTNKDRLTPDNLKKKTKLYYFNAIKKLEENDRKRKARKEKQILKKQKSKAKNKKEAKRKLFQESSSEEEEAYEECDDDMDNMVPNIIEEELNEGETCLICAESGKNEIWYRCIGCGGWIHKLCSGYDKPDNYICDFCK